MTEMTGRRMAVKKLHLDFWACHTCALLLALLLAASLLLMGLGSTHTPTQAQAQDEATGTSNEPPTLIGRWGGDYGSGDGEFEWIEGIATDSSGNVYVADSENHRIQKFDSEGNFLSKWGELGVDNGDFYYPEGVAIDSTGNVYVADSSNERVQKFGSNGSFITKWDVRDSYGDLDYPSDVAVDSSGNVFVSAYNSIYKFGADNGAAPKVSDTKPISGKKGVRRDANVTATFSEQMDSSTISYSAVRLVKASTGREVYIDSVSCDNPCNTVTIDPYSKLARETKYKAIITTEAKDLAGNALTRNYIWTFTTGRT